ncbi:hypothetical protein GCM10028798_27050 [Humibacter antri]
MTVYRRHCRHRLVGGRFPPIRQAAGGCWGRWDVRRRLCGKRIGRARRLIRGACGIGRERYRHRSAFLRGCGTCWSTGMGGGEEAVEGEVIVTRGARSKRRGIRRDGILL